MRLAHGLVVQSEVVTALLLREMRSRYGDSELGYLWAFLDTALMIGFMYLMRFGLTNGHPPPGMDTLGFLATGVVGYHLVTDTLGRAAQGVRGNQSLLVYPQVKVLDIVLGRVGLEAMTLIIVFCVIMTIDGIYLRHFQVDDPLQLMTGVLLAIWLGGAAGLVFCALEVVSEAAGTARGLLMRPMLLVSGVFFTAAELPVAFRDVLVWNPILHAVELIRSGWFASYESKVASQTYVLGWCIACSALGLLLEQAVRPRLEVP